MYIDITCFFPVSPSFSFFTISSYLLSSFCVPYVVSISRLSIFALHFGILLRLFWKCGSCILILLDKYMLWWFHVRINTNYVRYRSQHISDDGMYCMWLITMSIYNVFLYFYIFCLVYIFQDWCMYLYAQCKKSGCTCLTVDVERY
jgi:hypothetical protein